MFSKRNEVRDLKDCLKCKRWKECAGKSFFTYQEVRFCPYQVLWILEWKDTLLAGNWPDNPDSSSYVDPKIKTGYGSEAYFVKAVITLGEVNARLARTGIEGKLLVAEVRAGVTLQELQPESRTALMYVKGNITKRQSYSDWKKQEKFRGK